MRALPSQLMDRARNRVRPAVESLVLSVQRDNAALTIQTTIAIRIEVVPIALVRVRMIQSVQAVLCVPYSASMGLHRTRTAVLSVSAIRRPSKTCAQIGTINPVATMVIVLRATNVGRFRTDALQVHAHAMRQLAWLVFVRETAC